MFQLRKITAATAAIGALALGAGPAAANSVYGGAEILIQNLTVTFSGVTSGGPTSFTFNASDNANLLGAQDSNIVNCGGTLASNTCSPSTPVLDATAANAPGGTVTRNNLDFSLFGPGTNTYANSESAILTAELVQGGVPTSTGSVSEAELQAGVNGTASAATNVQSNTNLSLTFTVGAPGTLTVSFQADPYLQSFIDATGLFSASSLANIDAHIILTGSNGQTFEWFPNGTTTNTSADFFSCAGGLTCTENTDSQSLNAQTNVGAPPIPAIQAFSTGSGFTNYQITISGLTSGTYVLGLVADTSVLINQTPIPEPATLLLVGLGLVGAGFAKRRFASR